jgi:mRNA interferase MazF
MARLSHPLRGEIYLVNLDPVTGTELAKIRPAVIISNDIGNRLSERVTIAACTSRGTHRVYPFEVLVPRGEAGLDRPSKIALDQIRSVDKHRLGRRLGALDETRMREVDEALRFSLAL